MNNKTNQNKQMKSFFLFCKETKLFIPQISVQAGFGSVFSLHIYFTTPRCALNVHSLQDLIFFRVAHVFLWLTDGFRNRLFHISA